jgi:undecaprenyl-diphosphatase
MTRSTPVPSIYAANLRLAAISALIAILAATLALGLLTLLFHRLPDLGSFDHRLQLVLHSHATPALTCIMLAFTWLGAIKTWAPAVCLAVAWLAWRRHLHSAAILTLAMSGALVMNVTLKLHFERPRPQLPWSIGDEHTWSFPSGHALFAVTLYGIAAHLILRQRHSRRDRLAVLLPATLLPLLIGLSRIYLGEHYPTDILAGYLTGVLWLTAVIAINHIWTRQLQPPAPTLPPHAGSEYIPRPQIRL